MEPRANEPRFEVDGMLVKLARYLRVLGYDARWDLDLPLAERIARADLEDRIFVSRSHHIGHQVALPRRFLRVLADDPVEQLREVVAAAPLDPASRLFTRCIRCNVELAEVAKNEVAGRVPARTLEAYERFYTCPSCATVFWKGSHVRNTCRKLGIPDAAEGATSASPSAPSRT
jgi:uncharacterized protein with PIN domain